VVILRGHQANPWELRPWEEPTLAERFDVSYLRTGRGWFDTGKLGVASRRAWTLRDLLPPGRLGDLAVRLPGDRYLGLARALRGADIVHSQELGYWYSMQAARLRPRMGFRLVLTVWETIPFLGAYRNFRTRRYRAAVLAAADLYLAATERARTCLLLEGAPADRVLVCPPGAARERPSSPSSSSTPASRQPLVLSAGRLVWEKGHQDVLRAVALLRLGGDADVCVRIVGTGPDETKLRAYARELGIGDAVEFAGFIPHERMADVYREASCMVLASLPTWCWEEQFGMVLAEALAAGLPIVASRSGAIPEVVGDRARLFDAGDWVGLTQVLSQMCGADAETLPSDAGELYSTGAAARRLAAAYDDVLVGGAPIEGSLPTV
jgi:glycosyltransferase involved in cell wall biosynthesis